MQPVACVKCMQQGEVYPVYDFKKEKYLWYVRCKPKSECSEVFAESETGAIRLWNDKNWRKSNAVVHWRRTAVS